MEMKVHSSRKEEGLIALQNVGAAIFAGGVILACSAGNPLTLMICFGAMVAGSVDIFVCGILLDRLPEDKKRKTSNYFSE